MAISELETLVLRFEDLIASGELIGLVILSGKDSRLHRRGRCQRIRLDGGSAILPEALKRTHAVMDRIENLKAPVVAGIHGFCLGGGLELALACHYRIAVNDDKTRLGFPEVNLGIFPGFGGTGRSIRQAGPVDAMQAMLTGRMIKAGAARGMGLVDKLVRHRDNAALGSPQGGAAEAQVRARRRSIERIMAWGRSARRSSPTDARPKPARRRAASTIRRHMR